MRYSHDRLKHVNMKKYTTVIITNVIIFIVLGYFMLALGPAGVGATGVLLGAFNLLIAVLTWGSDTEKHLPKAYLLCGGILLLIGFSLCNSFRLGL